MQTVTLLPDGVRIEQTFEDVATANRWTVCDVVPDVIEFTATEPCPDPSSMVVVARRETRRVTPYSGPKPGDQFIVQGKVLVVEGDRDGRVMVWTTVSGLLTYKCAIFTDRVYHPITVDACTDPTALERLLSEVPADALRIGTDVNGDDVTLADLEEDRVSFDDVRSALQSAMLDDGMEDAYSNVTVADLVQGGTTRSAIIRWFAFVRTGDEDGDFFDYHVNIGDFSSRIYPNLGVQHKLVTQPGRLGSELKARLEDVDYDLE